MPDTSTPPPIARPARRVAGHCPRERQRADHPAGTASGPRLVVPGRRSSARSESAGPPTSSSSGRCGPSSPTGRRGACSGSPPSSSRASTPSRTSAQPYGLRVRPVEEGTALYEIARALGEHLARAGFAHHRRRPRPDGGREPGLSRGCGFSIGCNSSCRASSGSNPVGRPRRRVPLLLRPQDDVREVRGRLRDPARRLRHARRVLRGGDPDPDGQDPPLPGLPGGHGVLGRPVRLAALDRLPMGMWASRTWPSSGSPTTSPRSRERCVRSSTTGSGGGPTDRRRRPERPGDPRCLRPRLRLRPRLHVPCRPYGMASSSQGRQGRPHVDRRERRRRDVEPAHVGLGGSPSARAGVRTRT